MRPAKNSSMTIDEILDSDHLRAKAKARAIADLLSTGKAQPGALGRVLRDVDETDRATLIEGVEGAARKKPSVIDAESFAVLTEYLGDDAPRVRWEAARALEHAVGLHRSLVAAATAKLLVNAKDSGTVVRWSAARALARIAHLDKPPDGRLVDRITRLSEAEEDEGIRKIYDAAVSRVRKGQ